MQQARFDPEPTIASEETLIALLKRVARDALDLVQNEFALARAEGLETVATLRHTIAMMLIATTLLLAGALALVAGIVLVLALWMPVWVSALVIGGLLFGIGMFVFASAYQAATSRELDLPRTRESLNRDLELVKRNNGRSV